VKAFSLGSCVMVVEKSVKQVRLMLLVRLFTKQGCEADEASLARSPRRRRMSRKGKYEEDESGGKADWIIERVSKRA
jgi:hypothetical protein